MGYGVFWVKIVGNANCREYGIYRRMNHICQRNCLDFQLKSVLAVVADKSRLDSKDS
jgi:hypothetical protein